MATVLFRPRSGPWLRKRPRKIEDENEDEDEMGIFLHVFVSESCITRNSQKSLDANRRQCAAHPR